MRYVVVLITWLVCIRQRQKVLTRVGAENCILFMDKNVHWCRFYGWQYRTSSKHVCIYNKNGLSGLYSYIYAYMYIFL